MHLMAKGFRAIVRSGREGLSPNSSCRENLSLHKLFETTGMVEWNIGELDEMSFVDKTLTCRDCGEDFVFTAGEQEFYAEKGFTNEPTRCPNCRRANKARRNSSGGGASYGSGGYGGGRPERTMHPAVCSACGKETMVPFVPRNDKPVYCSDCFQSQREQRSYSRW
jgi:CxxC-x17-CxxC domain-containing protein